MPFFRNIRKQLAAENKLAKYMRYAIGEIVLVVMGILIALQINTWNQERLNANEEKQLLSNLNDEFAENKTLINDLQKILSTSMHNYEKLIGLIGGSKDELERHNLDSIFFHALLAYQFIATDQSINVIFQGGKMNIVQNDHLIKLLYKWQVQVKILEQQEQGADGWMNMKVMPYLTKYISFREMDVYGNFSWSGKSNLDVDYYPLFQSLEFENYIDNTLFITQVYTNELKKADAIASEIIELTEKY